MNNLIASQSNNIFHDYTTGNIVDEFFWYELESKINVTWSNEKAKQYNIWELASDFTSWLVLHSDTYQVDNSLQQKNQYVIKCKLDDVWFTITENYPSNDITIKVKQKAPITATNELNEAIICKWEKKTKFNAWSLIQWNINDVDFLKQKDLIDVLWAFERTVTTVLVESKTGRYYKINFDNSHIKWFTPENDLHQIEIEYKWIKKSCLATNSNTRDTVYQEITDINLLLSSFMAEKWFLFNPKSYISKARWIKNNYKYHCFSDTIEDDLKKMLDGII